MKLLTASNEGEKVFDFIQSNIKFPLSLLMWGGERSEV